jgi:glycosyltransferase involved in cell wall biosynthesis
MRLGLVLSQPFGHSIGTDARVLGLIKGLTHLKVEVHLITQFEEKNPINLENFFVHKISSSATFSNLQYKLSRRLMNNSFFLKEAICRESVLQRVVDGFGKGVHRIASKLDLDILQAEQPIASLACVRIRENLRIPVVADFHGIWCEELVASGLVDYDDNCFKIISGIEREIACSADASTVVSNEMKTYLERSLGANSSSIALIPNATFPKTDKARFVKVPSKIIHSGTLHPWENSELFVLAMPLVLERYNQAEFYFTRKGAKLKKIQGLAKSLNVAPKFVWFTEGEEFVKFLSSCDIGVISSANHIARRMAYPAKLYDYLSVGLPVVANDVGGWTKIIEEKKIGVITDNSPRGFAEGILELLENPELRYQYAQRGIDLVKREFNYYRTTEKLVALYRRLANLG